MQRSNRVVNAMGLALLILMSGAIQADPEAHPVLVDAPPAIETQELEKLG